VPAQTDVVGTAIRFATALAGPVGAVLFLLFAAKDAVHAAASRATGAAALAAIRTAAEAALAGARGFTAASLALPLNACPVHGRSDERRPP
jgi:hypothetical protein